MLELEPAPKKAICVAPSFGQVIPDRKTMVEALSTHVARAAEKLRQQGSAAGVMTVFLHTNRYRQNQNGPAKQYYNSQTVQLPHPTSATSELIQYADSAFQAIYQPGYLYQKIEVIISDLVPATHQQQALFTAAPDERLQKLSKVMDKLNQRHGRDKLRLASQGYNKGWHHRQEHLSRRYTTDWKDILEVR